MCKPQQTSEGNTDALHTWYKERNKKLHVGKQCTCISHQKLGSTDITAMKSTKVQIVGGALFEIQHVHI